jgi:hypothetical protein
MKKIVIALLVTFGLTTIVSAEIGLKVGVSAQIGSMETSGKEVSSDGTTTKSATEEALFGTAGFFVEKDLAFLPGPFGRLSIGYDNIAHDLDLGTQRNARLASIGAEIAAGGGTEVITATDHSLEAKVTGFETLYATLNVTDWLYLKAGSVTVDVDTKFSGSATSTYPTSHSLDGTVLGFGVEKSSDNGMFFRLEFNDYSIDGKSVANTGTDSKFTATLNDVSGSTGRISIGKAF